MQFEPNTFVGKIRTLQIIVISLVAGASMYLGFVVAQGPPQNEAGPRLGMLAVACLFVAGAALPMHRLLPVIVLSQARRAAIAERTLVGEALVDRLLMARQTAVIIGAAMCEGASFANSLAYSAEYHGASLGASILMILLALSFFPTVGGVQRWVENEVRTIEEMRQLG